MKMRFLAVLILLLPSVAYGQYKELILGQTYWGTFKVRGSDGQLTAPVCTPTACWIRSGTVDSSAPVTVTPIVGLTAAYSVTSSVPTTWAPPAWNYADLSVTGTVLTSSGNGTFGDFVDSVVVLSGSQLTFGTGASQLNPSGGTLAIGALPVMPSSWITANGIAPGALAGKGDWLSSTATNTLTYSGVIDLQYPTFRVAGGTNATLVTYDVLSVTGGVLASGTTADVTSLDSANGIYAPTHGVTVTGNSTIQWYYDRYGTSPKTAINDLFPHGSPQTGDAYGLAIPSGSGVRVGSYATGKTPLQPTVAGRTLSVDSTGGVTGATVVTDSAGRAVVSPDSIALSLSPTQRVTLVSPLSQSGALELIVGNDYSATDNRQIDITYTNGPVLTGGTPVLSVVRNSDQSLLMSSTGTVTASRTVRFQPTKTQTALLSANFDPQSSYAAPATYKVTVTLSNSNVVTPSYGPCNIKK